VYGLDSQRVDEFRADFCDSSNREKDALAAAAGAEWCSESRFSLQMESLTMRGSHAGGGNCIRCVWLKWCLVLGVLAGCSEYGLRVVRGQEIQLDNVGSDLIIEDVVLGVHGGTGVDKKDMTPELEKKIRAGLKAALEAGAKRLKEPHALPLDGVEAAIRVLEDDPHFNAGRGAVFTHEGRNELDASIMEGTTKRAGAVASVTIVRNPISAARTVMEKSKHVMMIGRGAEVFSTQQGLEIVDPAYFWTESRWKDISRVWAEEKKNGGRADLEPKSSTYFGTVGAVARNSQGQLAAGTSTGGMTNKMFGRVGDSPIIGAGTYAEDGAAAVSCTGHGEFFIRYGVSKEIVSQIKYRGLNVQQAAQEVINRQLKAAGGEGAAIVLNSQGQWTTSRNCEGLYRGWINSRGEIFTRLYEE
jgi:beta-aspartyl-peptidase (threonine type)